MYTRITYVLLGVALVGISYWLFQLNSPAAAETIADDESLIRELVRKSDEGTPIKRTENSIFSSGLTPKSLVGREEQEKFFSKIAEKIREERPKQKLRTSVQRVVIAKSGDLAYEYSTFRIEWDGDDNKRAGFDGSSLRVWLKVNGEWNEEAYFARPHTDDNGGEKP
jgi:ketosteroid isomerase-like protein